ncbi:hypothetical protein Q3A86_24430 [Streptomyces sp. NBUA17]|uniref:hypothetical protein n=1 Tax=Streptomyces sp. NBUA17 TaxID=3062275 RepID=UPI0037DA628C
MDSDFPGLAADVNVLGNGLVRLGTVSPEAADLLAELVMAGLRAELSGRTDTAPSTDLRETPAV